MALRRYLMFLSIYLFIVQQCLTQQTDKSTEFRKIRKKYKVFRIYPENVKQLKLLEHWQQTSVSFEVDFWKEARYVGDFADVMVVPKMIAQFEQKLRKENLRYVITVSDVQKLIERNERHVTERVPNATVEGRRFKDDPLDGFDYDRGLTSKNKQEFEKKKIFPMKAKYKFGNYKSYKDMLKYMRTIEFYYPNITKLIRIGLTHEKLPIEGIKFLPVMSNCSPEFIIRRSIFRIGKPSNGTKKRGFWIDANIHAREWASSHTALYFINQLIGGYGKDNQITEYVDKLDFFIFPCLNPDGYEYSRSSSEPQVRLWRKNRSTAKCIRIYGGQRYCCNGVDLNRNFDFHWAGNLTFGSVEHNQLSSPTTEYICYAVTEIGTSSSPCSNIYHGEKAFSEPETKAVKEFLTSEDMKNKLDGFITLHTYAQLWIHPFSHKIGTYPEDLRDLKITARRATGRLKTVYGTKYRIGTGANLLTPAAGGSDDWAKSNLGVKYVYLVELRPEYECNDTGILSNGFILHEEELMPTAIETWEGVKEVIDAVLTHRSAYGTHLTVSNETVNDGKQAVNGVGDQKSTVKIQNHNSSKNVTLHHPISVSVDNCRVTTQSSIFSYSERYATLAIAAAKIHRRAVGSDCNETATYVHVAIQLMQQRYSSSCKLCAHSSTN